MFVVSLFICKKSGLEAPENVSNLYFAQPQRITDDRHGTETHGRRRDHRAQKQAESRIQCAGCNRHRQRIIHKSEKKVLFDHADDARSPDSYSVFLSWGFH